MHPHATAPEAPAAGQPLQQSAAVSSSHVLKHAPPSPAAAEVTRSWLSPSVTASVTAQVAALRSALGSAARPRSTQTAAGGASPGRGFSPLSRQSSAIQLRTDTALEESGEVLLPSRQTFRRGTRWRGVRDGSSSSGRRAAKPWSQPQPQGPGLLPPISAAQRSDRGVSPSRPSTRSGGDSALPPGMMRPPKPSGSGGLAGLAVQGTAAEHAAALSAELSVSWPAVPLPLVHRRG